MSPRLHLRSITGPEPPSAPGLTIIPTGDANFWRLMEGTRWIAVIQFNGELMEARQVEIGRQFAAAPALLDAAKSVVRTGQQVAMGVIGVDSGAWAATRNAVADATEAPCPSS